MGSTAKWDAGLYDEKHSFVWKMAAGLVELLEPKPGEHILDIGCGTGHLTAQIAASGAIIRGIDQSAEMVRQAREKFPELRFDVMDARRDYAGRIASTPSFPMPRCTGSKSRSALSGESSKSCGPAGASLRNSVAREISPDSWKRRKKAGKRCCPNMPFDSPWFYPSVAEYAGLLEQHGLEVTYALLFDRPTPLEDGERGLRTWLEMFGGKMTGKAPEGETRATGGGDRAASPRKIVQGWPVGDGLPASAGGGEKGLAKARFACPNHASERRQRRHDLHRRGSSPVANGENSQGRNAARE